MPNVSHTLPRGEADGLTDGLGSPAFRAARATAPGDSPDPASPAGAFLAARRHYLAGDRIDMRALASELGVSRPTLYRWTGHREQLIGDVLFALSDDVFEDAKRRTAELRGRERLLAVFRLHTEAIVRSRPLQTFFKRETETALRVLTSRHGLVNPRTVRRLAALYREEQAAGNFHPDADVETLAFAVIRLAEGFIYNDGSAAVEPEVDRAAAVVGLLLRSR